MLWRSASLVCCSLLDQARRLHLLAALRSAVRIVMRPAPSSNVLRSSRPLLARVKSSSSVALRPAVSMATAPTTAEVERAAQVAEARLAALARLESGALRSACHAPRFSGTEEEVMSRIFQRAVPLIILLSLACASRAVADCTAGVCTDCTENARHIASCITVSYSASCSCSIDVRYPEFCILEGNCTYTGGGGTGGGGAGGGTPVCTRTPGEWCPSECMSCTTVFWY